MQAEYSGMKTAPNQSVTRRHRWVDVQSLSPAYFGMVMATGIVSLAADQIGFDCIALALFAMVAGDGDAEVLPG